jgi:hypothetical protein
MDPDSDSDADPDSDPDTSIFIIDLQDANKKQILKKVLLFFEGSFSSFFKGKKSKRSHKTEFCLMIEGSGSESGSIQ